MSAFLGPIHHWVFHKVRFQNDIVARLTDFAAGRGLTIGPALDETCGVLEDAPLEDIIDTGNIHGWLQERVSLVERRLAEAVRLILSHSAADEEALRRVFFDIGAAQGHAALPSAPAAYKLLFDLLLDGMPCDRVNAITAEHDDWVDWHQTACLHGPYWQEAGVDVRLYYALRESLIAGLLSGSDYTFEKHADECTIRRR